MATKNTTATATVLTCPECGKTFTRPASLGAHRQRLWHRRYLEERGCGRGSQHAQCRREERSYPADNREQAAALSASSRSNGRGESVNRDALLRTLFPAGIPPRGDGSAPSTAGSTKHNAWPVSANPVRLLPRT